MKAMVERRAGTDYYRTLTFEDFSFGTTSPAYFA